MESQDSSRVQTTMFKINSKDILNSAENIASINSSYKWNIIYMIFNYCIVTDWFRIGKGVRQGCVLSPCLFKLYSEYIMRNAGLDEAQAGIKISGRNFYKLRYADATTLWQ